MSLTIGISKASGSPKYQNYVRWLKDSGEEIEIVDLWASGDLDGDMGRIDALVLSGGEDVAPDRYGHPELEPRCHEIDPVRDEKELRMLDIAAERELPVLGICRGLQVLNVHKGGTLIAHLPDRLAGSEAHQKEGEADRSHDVEVMSGTLLLKAAGDTHGQVNSAHHQAIDELGTGLMIAARSADGVIEAIELSGKMGAPYLLGVQWHPERMADQSSPLSAGIREQFLLEAASARILAKVTKPLPKADPEPPEIPPAEEEGSSSLFPIIQ